MEKSVNYKAGDLVTVKLDANDANYLNANGVAVIYEGRIVIANSEPATFDWADVKPGMAFYDTFGKKTIWYAAPFYRQEDTHIIAYTGNTIHQYPHTPEGNMIKHLKRTPEHDIELQS